MTAPQKCSSPACDRTADVAGLCLSHYRRKMRGKSIDTPIRSKEVELEEMPGCRVPRDVYIALQTAARHKGVSLYEIQRQVNEEWFARMMMGQAS